MLVSPDTKRFQFSRNRYICHNHLLMRATTGTKTISNAECLKFSTITRVESWLIKDYGQQHLPSHHLSPLLEHSANFSLSYAQRNLFIRPQLFRKTCFSAYFTFDYIRIKMQKWSSHKTYPSFFLFASQ